MNIALWALAGLLALAFLAAGLMKLRTPEKLQEAEWARAAGSGAIRALGAAEVLGAIGLILPAALGIAPVLTPLAALGLAIVGLGATVVHLKAGEGLKGAAPALVLGLLSLFVAIMRFGPYAF